MDQDRFPGILPVEASPQAADKYHRKLQALGAVDGENLHRVASVGTALRVQALFLHAAQPCHETVQAVFSAPGEGLGHGSDIQKALKPLFPVRHGGRQGIEIQFFDHSVNEPRGIQVRGIIPQPPKPFDEALGVAVAGRTERGIEIRVRPHGANQAQFLGAEAESRRAQERKQRDIPMRIVHDREHRKDHGHLHTAVEVASRTGTDGNAHGEQDPAEYAAHGICRAQKDRDVPKADRAQRVAVPNGPVLHEGKNLGGGLGRFGLQIGIFRFLPRKEQKLRNKAARSSLKAGNQHVRRSVIEIAQALAHAAAEHRVDGIQDFRDGAEIFLQADDAFFAPRFCIKAVFFIENLGVGKAKAINRLLQVADKEQVFSRPADRAEDLVLNPADILVFIHHHLGEARGDFFRRLGGGSVNAGQKADRQMLKIRKIQGVDAGLCAAELVFQLLHHREQGSHPARGIPKIRKNLRRGGGE